jgi:FdhD protein
VTAFPGIAERAVVRYERGGFASVLDRVAVEAPLEIFLAGAPFSVTMRTPGDDEELALGFLLSEGLIRRASDLRGLHPTTDDAGQIVRLDAEPAPGHTFDVDPGGAARRGTLTTAACGVCGRTRIDDLLARLQPIEDAKAVLASTLDGLTPALREAQHVFTATGGLHAAAITDAEGRVLTVREDVGRHNSVDKAIGHLLLSGELSPRGHVLVVSGRSSFEIVQKAAMARLPVVVSVSAPSSLAIEVAEHAGITLVGFARGSGFNVYAHASGVLERVIA